MSAEIEQKAAFETSSLKRPTILLVEDEPDCARLIQDSIQDPVRPHLLKVVESGEAAIAYLSGQGRFADRFDNPFPFLVLLDLKMPGTGGFGVLRWLLTHPDVKNQLKVVILSSAQSPREIEVAYELGAQFFWPKSETPSLHERVRRVKDTWLRVN